MLIKHLLVVPFLEDEGFLLFASFDSFRSILNKSGSKISSLPLSPSMPESWEVSGLSVEVLKA